MQEGELVKMDTLETLDEKSIASFVDGCGSIEGAIVCSLKGLDPAVEEYLAQISGRYIRLKSSTAVPLKNCYSTPETLGIDRMAAAVGAASLYPSRAVLVVDFGTAITIDLVTAGGEFRGGNISPGVRTRFRSLNTFTASLPLVDLEDYDLQTAERADYVVASSTKEAIAKGVVDGIFLEIQGYIELFSRQYAEINVIFTGGDAKVFAKKFKNTIFATCDLVMYGLNRILEYNA